MTDSPSHAKSKRRWLQFSLRTFFVLLTIFAVWLGWFVPEVRQQRTAVERVEAKGGKVYYDYQMDEEGSFVDAGPPGPKLARDVFGLDCMDDVVHVELWGTQVTDISPLAGLADLRGLYLRESQVSDLSPLAGLKNLKELYLINMQIDDLAPLAELKNLKELSLAGTPASEEEVTRLRQALPNCEIDLMPPDL